MEVIYSRKDPSLINVSATAKSLDPGESFDVPITRWGAVRATAYFLNVTQPGRQYATTIDRDLGIVTIKRVE